MKLSREIFTSQYSELSNNAKWLFVVLNELEQRYTGEEKDFFFRTDSELASDCGFSLKVLKRAKAELKTTDLVQIWQEHMTNQKTGKKSVIHYTAYKILK